MSLRNLLNRSWQHVQSATFESVKVVTSISQRSVSIPQIKPNQFSVSYHIAQYTNIIADLRKEIFRLKLKISEHDTDKSSSK